MFAERGYHNTTPEVVADLAGVPEELLAKHFPDKASLFRAVLDEVRAATLDHWRSEAAALPDPLARLHAVAESYLGAARADAAEVRLLFRALADCDDKEVAGSLQAFFEECESFLAGILIEGQQAGVFRRAADARVGARQLVQTGLGHVALRQLGTEPPDEIDSLARGSNAFYTACSRRTSNHQHIRAPVVRSVANVTEGISYGSHVQLFHHAPAPTIP